jgi:ABC-type Na+ transport system ATPase subunit NatA/ABC-type lipoprotein release transport system permease subunit
MGWSIARKPIWFIAPFVAVLLIASIPGISAQRERVVMGRIVDASTGRPLEGAIVHISGWIMGGEYRWNRHDSYLSANETGQYNATLRRGFYILTITFDDPETPGVDYVPAILQLDLTEREQALSEEKIVANFDLFPGASVIVKGSAEFVEIGGVPESTYVGAFPVQRQALPEPALTFYDPNVFSILGFEPMHIVVPSGMPVAIYIGGSNVQAYIVEDNGGCFYNLHQGSSTIVDISEAAMNRNIQVVRERLASTWLAAEKLQSNGIGVRTEIEDLSTAFGFLESARQALREGSYSLCFIDLRAAYIMNEDVMSRVRSTYSDATFSPIPLSFLLVLSGFGLASVFIENNATRIGAGILIGLLFLGFYFSISPGWGLADPAMLLSSCVLAALIAVGLAILFPRIRKDVVTPSGVALASSLTSTFSLATRNLKRRRLRSSLILVSILTLVFAFTVFTSFQVQAVVGTGRPAQNYPGTRPPVGLMVVAPPGPSIALPTSLVEAFMADPEVVSVAPKVETSPDVLDARLVSESGENITIKGAIGISSEEAKMNQIDAAIVKGQYLMEEEHASEHAILISARASDRIQAKPGDKVKLVWRTGMDILVSENFTIAGIFDDQIIEQIVDLDGQPIRPYVIQERSKVYLSPESIVILNWKELLRLNLCDETGRQIGKLTRVNVQLKNSTVLVPFSIQLAKKWRFFIYASDGKEVKLFYYRKDPQLSGGTTIPMLLVLVGLNVLACTLNAVYERRKEIATLSLVGLNPSQISYVFLAEAGLVAFIGGVAGYLFGLGGPRALLSLGGPGFLTEKVSWTWSVAVILMAVIVAVSASVLPALKASTVATPKLPLKWKLDYIPAAKDTWLLHVPQLVSQIELRRFFRFVQGKFEEFQLLHTIPEKMEFKEIVEDSDQEKEVKKLIFSHSFAQEGSRAFRTENELALTRSRGSSTYSIDLAIRIAMLYNYEPMEVIRKTASAVRRLMLQWAATPSSERWGQAPELVRIEDLGVASNGKLLIKGVSMDVMKGEILGLAGEGRRALILAIAGLCKPASGSVTFGGIDTFSRRDEVKDAIGLVLQGDGLYEDLTVRQNLLHIARMEGMINSVSAVKEILDKCALSQHADLKMSELDPEAKRKTMIAQALIKKVSLLLLEDPFKGLKEAKGVESLLKHLNRFEGMTVICSGEDESELEFCDRIAVLKKGSIEKVVERKR